MITMEDIRHRDKWLPGLRQALNEYKSILYADPELILQEVLTGGLCVFNVNDEIVALARKSLINNEFVFYVAFAFAKYEKGFFNYKKLVTKHSLEIIRYVKNELASDRMDFMGRSDFHLKVYKRIFSELNFCVNVRYYIEVVL